MVTLSPPVTIDRLTPGPPHTTHAGRFAIPAHLMDGERDLGSLELVFDGAAAEQLHHALEEHLAGRGVGRPAVHPTRSRAELL